MEATEEAWRGLLRENNGLVLWRGISFEELNPTVWERGPTRRVLNQSYALPSRACMYNLEVRLLNRESPLIMPRELPADVT